MSQCSPELLFTPGIFISSLSPQPAVAKCTAAAECLDEQSAAATDLFQHQDLNDCDCRCICSDCSSCVQIVWQVACTAVCVLSALQCGLPGLQTRAGGRHCSCCRGYPACSPTTPLHLPLCCSGGRPASAETAQLHCAPLQSHTAAVSSGPVLQPWPGPARSAEYRPAAG